MLGLARGTVRIVPFDAGWPALFADEECCLRQRIGHLARDIQLVGSTSVPALDAALSGNPPDQVITL